MLEKLKPAIRELAVGDSLEVPFKWFTSYYVRTAATQLRKEEGLGLSTNCSSNPTATIVTRTK